MIKDLNNHDLILKIKVLVKEEKRITLEILTYLREIEDRRLFAMRGFSSLFEFCMKELGYSESSTNRRISAMRLMRILPEIKDKMEEGSVNLSTLCQLQNVIRKEEKLEDKKLLPDEKKELLRAIENKSQKECEREFAKISPETAKLRESERVITEDLTEIRFMATKEMMKEFESLKSHLSHKNVNTYKELFKELAAIALTKFEVKKSKVEESTFAADVKPEVRPENAVAHKNKRPAIPVNTKRIVWPRDQGICQYIDPMTKRKCESRHKLQYDHVTPVSKGGDSSPRKCQNSLCNP